MFNFLLFLFLITPPLSSFNEVNKSPENTTRVNNLTNGTLSPPITKTKNEGIEVKFEELKGGCESMNNKIGALLMKKHNCKSIIICYKIGQTVKLSRHFQPKDQKDKDVNDLCNGNQGVRISSDFQLVDKQKACGEYRAANGPYLDDFDIAMAQDIGTAFVGAGDGVQNVWHFNCEQSSISTKTPTKITEVTNQNMTKSPSINGTNTIHPETPPIDRSVKPTSPVSTMKSITTTEEPQENCDQIPCSIKLSKIYPGAKLAIKGTRTKGTEGSQNRLFVLLIQGAPNFDYNGDRKEFAQVPFYLEVPSNKDQWQKTYTISAWSNLLWKKPFWFSGEVQGELHHAFSIDKEFTLTITFTETQFVLDVLDVHNATNRWTPFNYTMPLGPVNYLRLSGNLELLKQPEIIHLKTPNGRPETNFAMELKRLWPGAVIRIDGKLDKAAKRMVIALNKDRSEPAKKQIVILTDDKYVETEEIEAGDSGMVAEFDFTNQSYGREKSEFLLDIYCATQFMDASHKKVDELFNRNPLKPGDEFTIKIHVAIDELDGTYYYRLTNGKDEEFAKFYTYGPEYRNRLPLETINHIWFGGDMKVTNVDINYGIAPKNILEVSPPLKFGNKIKISGAMDIHQDNITIELGMNDIQLKVDETRKEILSAGAYAMKMVIKPSVDSDEHGLQFSSFYNGEQSGIAEDTFNSEAFRKNQTKKITIEIELKQENYLIEFLGQLNKEKQIQFAHGENDIPYFAIQYIQVTGLELNGKKDGIKIQRQSV